jgi:hypothetical protein
VEFSREDTTKVILVIWLERVQACPEMHREEFLLREVSVVRREVK